MEFYNEPKDTEAIAASVPDTKGVYFVPAFTGLSAPHQGLTWRRCFPSILRRDGLLIFIFLPIICRSYSKRNTARTYHIYEEAAHRARHVGECGLHMQWAARDSGPGLAVSSRVWPCEGRWWGEPKQFCEPVHCRYDPKTNRSLRKPRPDDCPWRCLPRWPRCRYVVACVCERAVVYVYVYVYNTALTHSFYIIIISYFWLWWFLLSHTGLWKSKEELKQLRANCKIYEPQMKRAEAQEKYVDWKRAVERSLKWAQDSDNNK